MRVNILFRFPLALFLFVGCATFAQNSVTVKQAASTAEARERCLAIAVNRDIARFDSIVPLSPGQRSLLKESFNDIEAKKYINNGTVNPNRQDVSSMDQEIYQEEVSEVEDILRPKQLKIWNEKNKAHATQSTTPPSTAGTH